ncbi:hypothetical protein J19TS2_18830 [Cohnella xylanilytica]|nr:hypothetical protein J19TS2_18830 [Cohnella xylanilytica]
MIRKHEMSIAPVGVIRKHEKSIATVGVFRKCEKAIPALIEDEAGMAYRLMVTGA